MNGYTYTILTEFGYLNLLMASGLVKIFKRSVRWFLSAFLGMASFLAEIYFLVSIN